MRESGDAPRWLSDSRRLVFSERGALRLIDTRTGAEQTVLSLPGEIIRFPAPAPDDRAIYFVRHKEDGSVWLATLSTAVTK